MPQGLIKTLEAIGKAAGEKFIKSSYRSADVYFGLPLQVVKIEKQPPVPPVFAKLCRELAQTLSGGYQTVLRKHIESEGKLGTQEVFTVTVGDVSVVINGSMEVLEIGLSMDVEDKGEAKEFLRHVVVAANAGYLKAQSKSAELTRELKNI